MLALTSERAFELMATIIHTAHYRLEILDVHKLIGTAAALREVLEQI